MHPVLENFNQSGQNDASAFNNISKGDLTLNYMHLMYRDRDMLLKLVCQELDGGVRTESASFLPVGAGRSSGLIVRPAGRVPSSTAAAVAKRQQRERTSVLVSMTATSETMAVSARRRLLSSMVSDPARAAESAKAANTLPVSRGPWRSRCSNVLRSVARRWP